jgi:type VI secretion system protein ImpA
VSEVLMRSEEVLDFDRLLAPIPGEHAVGVDLRADSSPTSPYYAVKDARNAARAEERRAIMESEASPNSVDWRPVLQLSSQALAQRAKDLEVVAYLIEALVRKHGFAGLRDGFRVARELVEQFWDGLYPLPDEEGMETRVAPLTGLNGEDADGTLIAPIYQVPITEGSDAGPYSTADYKQALAIKQIADEAARAKRLERGGVSLENFEKAVIQTPARFFGTLVQDLTACAEEFTRLCGVLDEKCDSKAPPSSNIRGALAFCLETVQHVARDKLQTLIEAPPPSPEEDGAAAGEAPAAAGEAVSADTIRTRDDAFRLLLKVADFFHRTEPHTPVSYTLEQAVRWGRMQLPELLAELIPDNESRQQFFKQVGIRVASTPPAEE